MRQSFTLPFLYVWRVNMRHIKAECLAYYSTQENYCLYVFSVDMNIKKLYNYIVFCVIKEDKNER